MWESNNLGGKHQNIQNGKLIGAVTHVLVDDPTKGYAIFAENMLETAQGVAESNKLKDVS